MSLLSAPDKTPGRGDLRANLSKATLPTVISANPLDPSEPPMLPPQMPYYAPGRDHKNGNPEWINVFDKDQPCTPHRQPKLDKKSASKRVVAPSDSGRSRIAKTTSVPQRSVLAGTGPRRGGPRRQRRTQHSNDGDVFADGRTQPSEVRTADNLRATHQNPVFGNQVAPPALIPMQDWEFAPGLIHSTDGERKVIAYSEAILRSERTLAPGLTFRFMRLEAGALVHLQADADNTLQCVLGNGAIQVKIGDEPEFTMGGHGLFFLRPGVTARVQNKFFTAAGAELHVTEIAHLEH